MSKDPNNNDLKKICLVEFFVVVKKWSSGINPINAAQWKFIPGKLRDVRNVDVNIVRISLSPFQLSLQVL